MELPRLKIGLDTETFMPVYISDRYLHTLLMGKSGTGKSTIISNWWETDHYYKNAKVLIDPSGFLAKDAYSISRGKYCSLRTPFSLNPMRSPYSESQVVDLISECINQVISICTPNQNFTAKMRAILDDAVKQCLRTNRRTLLSVRDNVLNRRGDGETRDGITARLNFILSDDNMVQLLCGGDSIEWGDLIKRHETFILDCFQMSKEKMVFVGNIITQGIKNYFRYDRPASYEPLSLYIDEAHNFINPNMFDILNEGRKYKISCVLATQSFANIDERMARTMLNVGHIVAYRLGHREAGYVAREMDMSPQDIQFIEKYFLAYMTPKEKGIAKAPRPPIIKEVKPPARVEPQRNSKKPSWFTLEPLESYPQPESQ